MFAKGSLNTATDESVLDGLLDSLTHALPDDYVQFLQTHNGGEGFSNDHYIVLWRAEDLMASNKAYAVALFAPGIFLFGSDGGGEAFGFDTHDSLVPVVRIPFIGMERRYADVISPSFREFYAGNWHEPV